LLVARVIVLIAFRWLAVVTDFSAVATVSLIFGTIAAAHPHRQPEARAAVSLRRRRR
jgi:hypothetical protein